jgi:hypothetical protein
MYGVAVRLMHHHHQHHWVACIRTCREQTSFFFKFINIYDMFGRAIKNRISNEFIIVQYACAYTFNILKNNFSPIIMFTSHRSTFFSECIRFDWHSPNLNACQKNIPSNGLLYGPSYIVRCLEYFKTGNLRRELKTNHHKSLS